MSGVPNVFGSATSSIPLSQLDVNFNTPVTIGNTTVGLGNTVTSFGNVTLTNTTISGLSGGSANGVVYINSSNVAVASPTVLAFDGANLGVGVTPSAWGSSNKAIDLGAYASFGYRASNGLTVVANNLYINGSDQFIYKTSNPVALYQMGATGEHYWYNAPSGIAGNTVSALTRTMTLDISGNLLVGTTSNLSSRVGIQGASSTSSDYAIYCQNSSASVLFGTRDDGLFFTGTATNAPYNFSASGKTMIVNSAGQIGSLVSLRIAKTNINPAPVASFINQLEIVTFNYRKKDESGNYTEEFDSELNWGVIADDALSVAPDFVSHNSNGEMDGFHYDRMVAPLIKYVQELSAQVTTLQAQVTALQAKVGV